MPYQYLCVSDSDKLKYRCHGGPYACYYVCHQNYNLPKHKSIFDLSFKSTKASKNIKQVPSNYKFDSKTKEGHGFSVMNKDKILHSNIQSHNIQGKENLKNGSKLNEEFKSDWHSCIDAGSVAVDRRNQNKRNSGTRTSTKRSLPGRGQKKECQDIFLQMRSTSMVKERKVTRMLIALVMIFAICWLPFFIIYISEPFCLSTSPSLESGNVELSKVCSFLRDEVVFNVVTWLGYSNSMFNPIIYTLFLKDFRNVLRKYCCLFSKKK